MRRGGGGGVGVCYRAIAVVAFLGLLEGHFGLDWKWFFGSCVRGAVCVRESGGANHDLNGEVR